MATFSASDAILLIRDTDDDDDDDDDDDVYMCISKALVKKKWRDLKTRQKRKKKARARFTCDSTSSPLNRNLYRHTFLFFDARIISTTIAKLLLLLPDEGEEDERGGEDAKNG